jgi:hypothetical protein
VLDYPKTGYWLIVYQDREKRPTPRQQFIDAMVNLSGGPALHDVLGVPGTLMLRYGTNETQQIRDNTWVDFRANLTGSNVRNLYYQGHGSPSLIGGDYDTYGPTGNITGAKLSGPTSKAYLTSEWIKNNVTFNKYSGAKYFRCVFLDGCDTSVGDWPQAFGMNKATNSLAFYQNVNRKPHTRPSCFVGWQVVVGGSPQWGTTAPYARWRSEWMFNWGNNAQARELDSAFQLARSNSGWISATLMNSALRLYGYNKLGFLEYNNRSQWNGP